MIRCGFLFLLWIAAVSSTSLRAQTTDAAAAVTFGPYLYETEQVKRIFHGPEGQADFQAVVAKTEAERKPLADAIAAARQPVTHTIEIRAVTKD